MKAHLDGLGRAHATTPKMSLSFMIRRSCPSIFIICVSIVGIRNRKHKLPFGIRAAPGQFDKDLVF